jgi:hypothetical protein
MEFVLGCLYFFAAPVTVALTLTTHVFQDEMNGDLPIVPTWLFILFALIHIGVYMLPVVPVLLIIAEVVFIVGAYVLLDPDRGKKK